MTPDMWDAVQDLFIAAADLRPAEWQRFLDDGCGGNAELRAAVERMLAGDRKNGSGIQAAVAHEASRMFETPVVSERLGAYRVEHEIGRGGMGAVYLATRDDDQFQRRVAIKVISRADSADALERFREERQILANLDHPYIARLLDGGTTANGLPFFVMEYVEGMPVDVFCRKLDVKERCHLFLKICEAVSYAHRNLVVHRDLKPANILITSEGIPKLLDFGVAKLLDKGRNAQTTSVLARPMTPEYASPEQIRGLPVTTASDVYSLGAVFYEFLTGQCAQPISAGATPVEIERIICENQPVAPGKLVPRLDADLDNIALAAMRKEPERRYLSVDQFADDIRRYLSSMPVRARKDALWYRTAKFARRQRYLLIAVAGAVLALVIGTGIALAGARRARLNRDVAINERRRSEEHLAQIVSLSDRSLSQVYALMEQVPGGLAARKELVQTTLTLLEEASKDAEGNPQLRLALARAYGRLGDIDGDLDSKHVSDSAGAVKSYRAATGLIANPAADRERLTFWAELQDKIGQILPSLGDASGARQTLEHAISMVETSRVLPAADSERLRGNLYLSLSRATLESRAALDSAQKSLESAKKAAALTPDDRAVEMLLSTAETQTGYVQWMMGDVRSAEPHYAASMHLRERLVREHPNDPVCRRSLKLAYEHYASIFGSPDHANLGRPDLARFYYAKARPLEEAAAANSPNSLNQFDYALFLYYSARVEETPRALEQLRKSAAILSALISSQPGVASYGSALGAVHEYVGRLLGAQARYRESIDEYRRAIAAVESVSAADRSTPFLARDAVNAQLGLTRVLIESGDQGAAFESASVALQRAGCPVSPVLIEQIASEVTGTGLEANALLIRCARRDR